MAEKGGPGYAGQMGWSVGLASWLDASDSPVRRYWRTIEYGSAQTKWPWVGQYVIGLWGPQAGTNRRPGRLIGTGKTPFLDSRSDKFIPYFKKMGRLEIGQARKALWDYMEGGKGPNMEKLKVDRYMKSSGGKRRVDGTKSPVYYSMRPVFTPAQAKRARASLFHWFMTGATEVHQIPFVVGQIKNHIEPGHYYRKALAGFPIEAEQAEAIKRSFAFAMQGAEGRSALQRLRKVQAEDNYSKTASRGPARRFVDDAGLRRYGVHSQAFVVVSATPVMQSLTRDAKGRFVNGTWQIALREANELVAMRFQQAVVEQMNVSTERPSTGDMRKATTDRRNRYPRDL